MFWAENTRRAVALGTTRVQRLLERIEHEVRTKFVCIEALARQPTMKHYTSALVLRQFHELPISNAFSCLRWNTFFLAHGRSLVHASTWYGTAGPQRQNAIFK